MTLKEQDSVAKAGGDPNNEFSKKTCLERTQKVLYNNFKFYFMTWSTPDTELSGVRNATLS
jgi:hypothetical protein